MSKVKEYASLALAIIALVSALGTYSVLQYRVDQLEVGIKASTEKHDALRGKVTELVTEVRILLDRQARPPGPAAVTAPKPPPPDPLREDVDEVLRRIRRDKPEQKPPVPDPPPRPDPPPAPDPPPKPDPPPTPEQE